ncbi:hypothetical protein VT50_0236050 [Streptomyces antioxidans]|uniref:Uncharacterized protein n=1 Tax=Streptomyces antioxidans TaxID=1507734 RepID=A0A1V4CU48_9ACTN|nr:hypothetical protein VT50_0236050 [Streptomyces antioxidans]
MPVSSRGQERHAASPVRGLSDLTRIAAADPGLWSDVLQPNATAVAGVLRNLNEDLLVLLAALDDLSTSSPRSKAQSMKRVVDLLDRGVAGLKEISQPATRRCPAPDAGAGGS